MIITASRPTGRHASASGRHTIETLGANGRPVATWITTSRPGGKRRANLAVRALRATVRAMGGAA